VSCTYETVESVAEAYKDLYPDNHKSLGDLQRFLKALVEEPEKEVESVELKVCEDKKKRTQIHTIFRHCPFLPPLETNSNSNQHVDGEHVIIVAKVARKQKKRPVGNPGKRIARKPWPGGKQQRYIKFLMEKMNIDSNQALNLISRTLHVPQKLFSVAGTKDKRAVTCQFVTGFQVDPERLRNLNDNFKNMLKFGNFRYCKDPLGLGDLRGNVFEIVLRGLQVEGNGNIESDVASAVETTRLHGFINYFGLQRFGTGDISTHKIGEYLLCGNWKAAMDSILSAGKIANSQVQEALNVFIIDRDANRASKMIPGKFSIQKAILEYLAKHGNTEKNYPAALLELPKTSRNLYVHAFHSYVWNNVVSERMRVHGFGNILPGDLVLAIDKDEAKLKLPGKRKRINRETSLPEPHIVTKEDIELKKYEFKDIVMPLPGSSIIYPQNATAVLYDRFLGNVDKDNFHNVRQFQYSSFPGDYRHILYRPDDLQYKFYRYNDPDEEIPCFSDIVESHQGSYVSLLLKFTLPPSTYATMLIREITKMPTDVSFAKNLEHRMAGQL